MPVERQTQIGEKNFKSWIQKEYDEEITTIQLRERRSSRDNTVNMLIGEALAARRLDEKERLTQPQRKPTSSTKCRKPTRPKK